MCTIQVNPPSTPPTPITSVAHLLSFHSGTVWQLVGLTNWVLDFLERLMKECVLFGEQPAGTEGTKVDGDDGDDDDDDLFGSAPCE